MSSKEAKLCQGKDVFERMNYLYQASRLIAKNNKMAASHYGNIMTSCAKKAVLRIEPDIKRTICKGCHLPLVPGETARVRLISKPTKAIKWTCLVCETIRKMPVSKKPYKLWLEEPESLVQTYNYGATNINSVSATSTQDSSIKKAAIGSNINVSNFPKEEISKEIPSRRKEITLES